MEGTNYREISYAEAAAKDNSLFSAWTRKWGMHVRPWYNMDKLKFSFVEVGKSGKGDSFDIYMDIIKYGFPCFKKWANDILSPSGRFERIMNHERQQNEKYPKAYKYTTGEKGNKSIGICNSTNGGYCINASISKDGKNVYANIPVDFGDLQILAQAFTDSYAEREIYLRELRKKSESEFSKHYEDTDTSTSVLEDAELIKSDNTDIMTATIGLPEKGNGEFIFKGTDKDDKPVILHVANVTMKGEQKDKWNKLAENLKISYQTVDFKITSYEDKDGMWITEIAN